MRYLKLLSGEPANYLSREVRKAVRIQPVDATDWLNISAGV